MASSVDLSSLGRHLQGLPCKMKHLTAELQRRLNNTHACPEENQTKQTGTRTSPLPGHPGYTKSCPQKPASPGLRQWARDRQKIMSPKRRAQPFRVFLTAPTTQHHAGGASSCHYRRWEILPVGRQKHEQLRAHRWMGKKRGAALGHRGTPSMLCPGASKAQSQPWVPTPMSKTALTGLWSLFFRAMWLW